MKIAFKIPMAEELALILQGMSDKDAGAAFKAALAYRAGGEVPVPVLSPGAALAFAAMRELIDLSRMKSAAGRAGGNAGHFAGKRKHAPTGDAAARAVNITAGSVATNTAESITDDTTATNPGNIPPPEDFDILAGLDAFM